MMIRWQGHCEKGVTDGRMDGRTDRLSVHRAAWSQLKKTTFREWQHHWQIHYDDVIWATYGVSFHRRVDCLFCCLFRFSSKKTSKSGLLSLMRGIHRSPVDSPHKGPITRKPFPFDDVIMDIKENQTQTHCACRRISVAPQTWFRAETPQVISSHILLLIHDEIKVN